MSLADVTAEAVLAAVAEFDNLGREALLEKYGFRSAKAYFLDIDGELYDLNAIVGVAHGKSGDRTWRPVDFTNDDRTVAERLRELGFTVRFFRNPDWTQEEIILVCALVAENGWRTIAQEDKRAIELSALLRSAAIHSAEDLRNDSFRNPAGVERKSNDLVSLLPGRKPTHGSRLDREVLEDFLRAPDEMRARANAIRELFASKEAERWIRAEAWSMDLEAKEGGVLLRWHLYRERDSGLRREKLTDARRRGIAIACEVCGFDFYQTYGDRGRDYIECHHRVPLWVTGTVRTRPSDLAMVCSNCHRMIHRSRQWLTVEELRDLVNQRRANT